MANTKRAQVCYYIVMISVSEEEFAAMVGAGMDAISPKYIEHLNNIVFVTEDTPSAEQIYKLKLRHDQSLFGLYEGIPLTRRGSNYNLVLPDKITIFKNPLEMASNSIDELRERVRHTVWHEVAHFYGLDHDRINSLEKS